jgi:hypothetical protein
MPKKTKIIFIATFIIVGIIILSVFFFINKAKNNKNPVTPIENQTFNPFGTGGQTNNNQPTENNGTKIEWANNLSGKQSRFYQITDFAVAGAGFFEYSRPTINPEDNKEKTEIVPALRYVERVTGHVYQMLLDTKDITKISNSTIPGVYEVILDKLANTFIYRYLSTDNKTITSFMASLGDTKGEFLPSDIIEISLSPDKNKSFYLIKNSNGVVGFTLSFGDNKKTQIFTSSFDEWLSQWVTDQKIYLTTKPSWSVSGSLFSLDINSGTLTKLFGGVDGLTTLANKDGSQVLYGASLETGPKLWLLNVKDHTTKDLNTYGLPEKCVWGSDNIYVYCAVPNTVVGTQYPDYWYQGLTSFDDYFVKINTQTAQRTTLANSKDEIPVDAIKMFLDKNESKLFFINKKDSYLWSLDL